VNVVISQEHRFDRTPDGAVWTQAAFPESYFAPYLEVFDSVRVVARVRNVDTPPPNARRADGNRVVFHAVPYYVGPEQFLAKWRLVRQTLTACVGRTDAVILRVQSQIAAGIEPALYRRRHPYALEVMCDPFAMFAAGCNDHPLRPLFQRIFYHQMRKQCGRASAVSYVTEQSLQQKYPPAKHAFTASYSNVEMPAAAYVATAKSFFSRPAPLNVITVASLDQPYKGVDVLIDAVKTGIASGLDLTLTVIGDGILRGELESRANKLAGRVRFLGHVSAGASVREYLDKADIFTLPSRTEGLPRALIEAMARALPCICSAVGGIPELLPASDLVPAGNSSALYTKLREVAVSPERMSAMSVRNLTKSQQYRDEVLRHRRFSFYRNLKEITEAWINRREG
jgi:glycosyltransferase involved in cell wall biosynthesis